MPRVIEELLRWNGPVLFAPPRLATRDMVVGGLEIPAGSIVEPAIGAANRDPVRFEDPDSFLADRHPRVTLSFSTGAPYCAGSQVARSDERRVGQEGVRTCRSRRSPSLYNKKN